MAVVRALRLVVAHTPRLPSSSTTRTIPKAMPTWFPVAEPLLLVPVRSAALFTVVLPAISTAAWLFGDDVDRSPTRVGGAVGIGWAAAATATAPAGTMQTDFESVSAGTVVQARQMPRRRINFV
ncbi:hypothetical protein SPI_04375 [Niveomyces insectorum RCEF 264]|uniref:Uncharacterized protein n=1 Tax=Niveomyces insectorum RCEF 264 TaxID=1081102 RepID=A0A167VP19_9HYPO|nr:hypothetical protein SPI_04375 [Niveomyces insectorum RCEF 264]